MRCPQPHATTSVATDLRRGGKDQRYEHTSCVFLIRRFKSEVQQGSIDGMAE